MSKNEYPVSQATATGEANVNKSRRRLSKVALATPVIASLASRPSLAGNCLSNMLSGNLSDPNRGQCSTGWSPGGWKNESGYPNVSTWAQAGFDFYTSTMGSMPAELNKNAVPTSTLLRIVLDDSQWPRINGGSNGPKVNWTLTNKLVCAYLNASLSDLTAFNYILRRDQVVDLATGAILPPGGKSLQGFLDSTWS